MIADTVDMYVVVEQAKAPTAAAFQQCLSANGLPARALYTEKPGLLHESVINGGFALSTGAESATYFFLPPDKFKSSELARVANKRAPRQFSDDDLIFRFTVTDYPSWGSVAAYSTMSAFVTCFNGYYFSFPGDDHGVGSAAGNSLAARATSMMRELNAQD